MVSLRMSITPRKPYTYNQGGNGQEEYSHQIRDKPLQAYIVEHLIWSVSGVAAHEKATHLTGVPDDIALSDSTAYRGEQEGRPAWPLVAAILRLLVLRQYPLDEVPEVYHRRLQCNGMRAEKKWRYPLREGDQMRGGRTV